MLYAFVNGVYWLEKLHRIQLTEILPDEGFV